MNTIYSAVLGSSGPLRISIEVTQDGVLIHGLGNDAILFKEGHKIKLEVIPESSAQVVLNFEPHLKCEGS